MLLLQLACLINTGVYEDRHAQLADEDADGYRPIDGDCNDADSTVHPAAPEQCDQIDNDCNGEIDDGVEEGLWYADGDGIWDLIFGGPEDNEAGDVAGAITSIPLPY